MEVDLEYLKDLRELHNGYSLAPDKIAKKKSKKKCSLMIRQRANPSNDPPIFIMFLLVISTKFWQILMRK